MSRFAIGFVWAGCVVVLSAGAVAAQPPAPGARPPTYSPYLNLARPGGTPALNYYGLVRPEQQFRQSIQNLQGVAAANQQAIGDIQAGGTGLPTTGHPTQFMNYGGYFLSNAPTGAALRGAQTINRPAPTTSAPRRTR